jgi:hypothetical protein
MRSSLFAITANLVAWASAECTKDILRGVTRDLLAAHTAGTPSFDALAESVTYTENRKKVDIESGILTQPLKIDFNRTQHDVPQCAAFAEIIVTDSANPYVIHSQVRLDNSTYKVVQLDSIITTKGDWLFNVTGTYYWASREKWDEIPEDKRDTRETIQAAGDAYCDLFNDKSVQVPWGQPCARLEGGAYTGRGAANDRCDVSRGLRGRLD